jgi:hypothetical protein
MLESTLQKSTGTGYLANTCGSDAVVEKERARIEALLRRRTLWTALNVNTKLWLADDDLQHSHQIALTPAGSILKSA